MKKKNLQRQANSRTVLAVDVGNENLWREIKALAKLKIRHIIKI
jgi:hypothetical protein